jgi:hypothetical protein
MTAFHPAEIQTGTLPGFSNPPGDAARGRCSRNAAKFVRDFGTLDKEPETVIVVQPNESHLAHADLNKLLPWPVKNFRNGELPLRWSMDGVYALG